MSNSIHKLRYKDNYCQQLHVYMLLMRQKWRTIQRVHGKLKTQFMQNRIYMHS